MMFKGSRQSGENYLSLLEVKVFMEPLLAQIRAVACICFTNKFIDGNYNSNANIIQLWTIYPLKFEVST